MSERRVIKLEQPKTVTPVSAKCCLWFAWANDTLNGPEGENTVALYKPIEVDVTNIMQVTVSVDPNNQWAHHPGTLSNADGINDVRDLENPLYQSPTYQSSKIKTLKARLNLLVGMIAKDVAPTAAEADVAQFEIGLGKTIDIVDATANRLFIGFHDGRHWTNNEEKVNITLTFTNRHGP